MKAVLHILYKNKDINKDFLFKNKNLCDYSYKHFLLTNEINLNKTMYNGFEQIFYMNDEIKLTVSLMSLLKFMRQFGYKEINIVNCNYEIDLNNFKNIDELITNFSVIHSVVNI